MLSWLWLWLCFVAVAVAVAVPAIVDVFVCQGSSSRSSCSYNSSCCKFFRKVIL